LSRLTQDENLLEQPETVAEFFANPPGWLTSQLKVYRENPELHFKPLCTAVAAMILGDGGRAVEVADEVRRQLADLGEPLPEEGGRMSENTERERSWELIEERPGEAGEAALVISQGTEAEMRWLGGITVPQWKRNRLVLRPMSSLEELR
jgi:hypothetical protein